MRVLFADKINKRAKEILEDAGFIVDEKPGLSEEEYVSIIKDYDAMVVRSGTKVTRNIIDAGEKLKVIGRAGVGVDNIDLNAARERGIAVMNAPTANTNAAAEHTITLLMMLAKHIIHSNISMKKGEWDRKKYMGIELRGKNLGIIGLGKVGRKVAKVAIALEMNVFGYDPYLSEEDMQKVGIRKVEFEELIEKSDFITVHVPLNEKTRNLISKKEFEKMKDGVRILNVARGGIINEKDLYEAIKNGKVAAAAIDVYKEEPPTFKELIKLDQVISTPHLGASTIEAQVGVAVEIAEAIIDALKYNKLKNVVNNVTKLRP